MVSPDRLKPWPVRRCSAAAAAARSAPTRVSATSEPNAGPASLPPAREGGSRSFLKISAIALLLEPLRGRRDTSPRAAAVASLAIRILPPPSTSSSLPSLSPAASAPGGEFQASPTERGIADAAGPTAGGSDASGRTDEAAGASESTALAASSPLTEESAAACDVTEVLGGIAVSAACPAATSAGAGGDDFPGFRCSWWCGEGGACNSGGRSLGGRMTGVGTKIAGRSALLSLRTLERSGCCCCCWDLCRGGCCCCCCSPTDTGGACDNAESCPRTPATRERGLSLSFAAVVLETGARRAGSDEDGGGGGGKAGLGSSSSAAKKTG